jgi:hypothetical protein
VVAVALGQGDQARAVEVDAVVVDEVRVLAGVLAARPEPDLALRLVDAIDPADDPVALGDRVLHPALLGVDQVEVPPAVLLGDVNDLVGLLEPGDEVDAEVLRVRGPDERVALLVDQVAARAGVGVHLDDAEPLVAAVDLGVRERVAVAAPADAGGAEVDLIDLALDLLLAFRVEQVQLVGGERVARQRVGLGLQLRPPAARRRGLDLVDRLDLGRLDAARDDRFRVPRPADHAVGVALLAVAAELGFLAVGGPEEEVELLDEGGPLAVGGPAGAVLLGLLGARPARLLEQRRGLVLISGL